MYMNTNIFNMTIGLSIIRKRKEKIYGYTNRCDDGKFIIFLDYDDLPIEWIEQEVKHLQETYDLGDFYIFKSSNNGIHAVCFTKVTLTELQIILLNSSVCTEYVKIPFQIGKRLLTLRLTEKNKQKPIFYERISTTKIKGLESFEHKQLIQKLFNCISKENLESNNDYENPTKLIFSNYEV